MSRIRSVHPGFFKDDRLVPCSAFARLLFIGLGVESDDKGIFEWKPVTLKMNIFPGDNIEIVGLLDELLGADAIMRFEANDRTYGAIRNFRKYQKPKTPNDIHPMPDYVADYVSFPQKGEKPTGERAGLPPEAENSIQMEDGGWKMEDETIEPPALSLEPAGARDLFGEAWEAFPRNPASVEALAENAFRKLKPKDQERCAAAAKRYRQWFEADNRDRDRTNDAGARFAPFMAKWIESGAWKQAETMLIPGQPTAAQAAVLDAVEYVDRHLDTALFEACERIREKRAPTSSQRWGFPKGIVAQARKELTH